MRSSFAVLVVAGSLGAGACSTHSNGNGPDASIDGDVDMSDGVGGGGSPEMGDTSADLGASTDLGWTPNDVAQYVNPFIGTSGGETWPGADTPFGMLQWSPENTNGNQT